MLNRLTPYKQNEQRWADLATAIEEFWDTYHQPHLQRVEGLRSIFQAAPDDIERMLDESGIQFEVAVPIVESNRAFAYAWRSYEIHRKDHSESLSSVLTRDFSGLEVRWEPLFAPRDMPYGEGLMLTRSDIALRNLSMDDYHRTYRGVVMADLSGIRAVGYETTEFSKVVGRKIDNLRPAHIVHEGEAFFQRFTIEPGPFPVLPSTVATDAYRISHVGVWNEVYDVISADARITDFQPLSKQSERGSVSATILHSSASNANRGIRDNRTISASIAPSATRKGYFSLPLVTESNRAGVIEPALFYQSAARAQDTPEPWLAFVDDLPPLPAYDDLPADLAPLDMYYEEI